MATLAFDAQVEENVQRDIILLQDGKSFRLQKRTDFIVTDESCFDNEDDAYDAFEKVIG